MARNYDKTYLDGLIAKAKKSLEGVDADCYMNNLRDDSPDKEDAEELRKSVESLRKAIEKSDGEGDLEEIINATSIDMKVRIKKLCPEAKIPEYAHPGDAGMDLYATSKSMDEMCNTVYGTGIAVEIPEGYVGLVFPRSSNSKKTLWLTNHVGVIDSGYRGEITFKFRSTLMLQNTLANCIRTLFKRPMSFVYLNVNDYKIGDKIGQLIIMPYPKIEFEEVEFLFPGDRGVKGYGSTGE